MGVAATFIAHGGGGRHILVILLKSIKPATNSTIIPLQAPQARAKTSRRDLRKTLDALEKAYLQLITNMLSSPLPGDVAQLGERDNRTVEARGSSPLISTATILN